MALRSITLEAGECAIIPSTATIVSVTTEGSGQLQTDCTSVPPVSDYVCWRFHWAEDSFDGGAYFDQLIIGSNTYNIPTAYNQVDGDVLDPLEIGDWFTDDPILAGIAVFECLNSTITSPFTLKIKVPSGLGAPELKIVDPSTPEDVITYLKATEDEDCDDCS